MTFADEIRAAFRRGDNTEVLHLAEAEVARARAAGEPAAEVEGLYATARVALREGDLPRAEDRASRALDVALRTGDRRMEERPRHVLAAVARMGGDHALARDRYLASIDLNRDLGQQEQVTSESYNLALTELHLGNLDAARRLFAEVRTQVFREGYRSFVPYLGVAAAALATAQDDDPSAARMIGFTDRAFADIGQVPDPDDAQELAAARSSALAALGTERFDSEYEVGASWDPAAAFGIDGGA